MDIGRRVREIRENLGMPRTVLARRVGVANNTIFRIETGNRTPSVGLLERIAKELRTETSELPREPRSRSVNVRREGSRISIEKTDSAAATDFVEREIRTVIQATYDHVITVDECVEKIRELVPAGAR